jgi:hypothetical protein
MRELGPINDALDALIERRPLRESRAGECSRGSE